MGKKVVAKIKRKPGKMYYVDGEGRVIETDLARGRKSKSKSGKGGRKRKR